MRIEERERGVAGERDPLSGRMERGFACMDETRSRAPERPSTRSRIDMGLDEIGERLELGLQRLRLARLHETEMPLGQRDPVVARQRADDGNADRLDRLRDQPAMTVAADAVDDDACKISSRSS